MFVVSGAMLLWPLIKGRLSSTEQIGTLEATRLINNENPLLLDVREPNEYGSGAACRTRCTFRCRRSRTGRASSPSTRRAR